jgi:hypothetical protein
MRSLAVGALRALSEPLLRRLRAKRVSAGHMVYNRVGLLWAHAHRPTLTALTIQDASTDTRYRGLHRPDCNDGIADKSPCVRSQDQLMTLPGAPKASPHAKFCCGYRRTGRGSAGRGGAGAHRGTHVAKAAFSSDSSSDAAGE